MSVQRKDVGSSYEIGDDDGNVAAESSTECMDDSEVGSVQSRRKRKGVHFADSDGFDLVTWFSASNSSASLHSIDIAANSIIPTCDRNGKQPHVNLFNWDYDSYPLSGDLVSTSRSVLLSSLDGQGNGELRGLVRVSPQITLAGEAIEHPGHSDINPLSVTVRYTMDGWRTYFDEHCRQTPSDSSVYSFSLFPPYYLDIVELEFAVRMTDQRKGEDQWDNNMGGNYRLRRLSEL